jgi:hypothetical protein
VPDGCLVFNALSTLHVVSDLYPPHTPFEPAPLEQARLSATLAFAAHLLDPPLALLTLAVVTMITHRVRWRAARNDASP